MDTQHRGSALLAAGLVIAGLAAGLGGCGGGYGGGSGGSYGMTPTPAPTPAPAPAPAPAPGMTSMKYATTNLVSDGGVAATHTDANLKNGWGLAFNPTAFAWVIDNGTSKASLYDGNGVAQALVVSLPAGLGGPASPTGIVFNSSQDFKISQSGITTPSTFIFVGESGTVSGWSSSLYINTTAVTAYDGSSAGKIYKGATLASNAGANYLYAADFHNNSVDVFNGSFARVNLPGSFTDPGLPAGYAPYGIQAIGARIYVTYGKQDADAEDEVAGAGLGVVDAFDTGGNFLMRFASGGVLNAPWGMAMAPANFGAFSGDLLVGNFGDGKINAFNPNTGALVGTLSGNNGNPIVIDGLWGIAFGNGVNNQPANTLFFTAGPGDETHGLYGRIDVQ